MDAPNSFQVLPGDFVSTDDGTGIVHMSPAYGEDDMATAQAADIVAVTPVDAKGRFDATVPDYAGRHVFEANPQIIRDLKIGAARRRRTVRCSCDMKPTNTHIRTAGGAATR